MRLRVRASGWLLGVLASALALSLAGCDSVGDPQAYATRPAISKARTEATARAEAVLADVSASGRVMGVQKQDWCDPGQSNLWVKSSFKFRCELSFRALAAPGQSSVPEATASMRQTLAAAGCSVDGLTEAAVERGLQTNVVGLGGHCGSVYVSLEWYTRAAVARRSFSEHAPGPNGFNVSLTPFDAGVLDQIDSTEPFAWMIVVGQEYVDESR